MKHALLACLVGALVFSSASLGRGNAENTWSGTWSGTWGTMTLKQSGRSVDATYTHDQGHISGTISGNVMTGRWDEAPTRKGPNDAGAVILTLDAKGKSFTGDWNYDGDGTWHKNDWSGTCSAGDCTKNGKSETITRPKLPDAEVPLNSVSNGCGGAGWASIVAVQNYFGNTSTYSDSNINPAAASFTVSFLDACNLHDAGYSGAIVADKIRGGIKDFRKWTRKQVDAKFLADMRFLCLQQIPATAATARTNCRGRGGNASFGAESRHNFVRRWGNRFFDADLGRAGTQRTGPRANT